MKAGDYIVNVHISKRGNATVIKAFRWRDGKRVRTLVDASTTAAQEIERRLNKAD